MNTGLVLLGVVVLVGVGAIWAYNRFVLLTNRCEEGWSDIDVQLKRRYDLIPNLVSTVQGYAKHEASVFEKVTEARAKSISADSAGNLKDLAQAENMLN